MENEFDFISTQYCTGSLPIHVKVLQNINMNRGDSKFKFFKVFAVIRWMDAKVWDIKICK